KLDIPFRKTAPAYVITDQVIAGAEFAPPMPPHRTMMVEVDVRQPIGRFDQRLPLTGNRVGQRGAIGTLQEPNLLRRGGRLWGGPNVNLRAVPTFGNFKTDFSGGSFRSIIIP